MDELELLITKVSDPHNYQTTLSHLPSNNRYHCEFSLELDKLTFIERLNELDEKSLQSVQDTDHKAEAFGKELFHTVLQGEVQDRYRRYTEDGEIRIRLRVEPEELKNIPWEFMHDGEDFIVTRASKPFSRIPFGIELRNKKQLEGPLRMLIVISNPLDLAEHMRLDTEMEMEALSYAFEPLEKENLVETVCCDNASVDTIRDFLMEQDYHILHFIGHGCFDTDDEGQEHGYLLMEDSQGKERLVDNEEFARLIQDTPSLRLVTLSACQSAKASKTENFRDLARTLLRKQIPAVVAMRISVFDSSAITFARTFYRTIAHKKGLDVAMAEARKAMILEDQSNKTDFATPILFLNDPHCLDITELKAREKEEIKIRPVMFGSVSVMQKGFVGRHREIRRIRDGFRSDNKRLAMICGFGGIGKSVLATTIAKRMENHFQLIKAIKCTPNTTAEGILGEINSVLMLAGIHDFNQFLNQPYPIQTKTDILLQIMTQIKLLLILDNCESILNDKRKIADGELAAMINQLLNGLATKSKVIITTRWEFDPLEGRLQEGVIKIHLPEFNFFTARQLMNRYERLADFPVEKKLEVFKKIGGHPYTYEIFDKHIEHGDIDSLLEDLAPVSQELKSFTLLEKTYQRLPDSAQILLQKLSVFEESFPIKAIGWMAEETNVHDEMEAIIGWGLMAREMTEEGDRYSLYAMVREYCGELLDKNPDLDRKQLTIQAGEYYEDLVNTSKSLWDHLLARDYFFRAKEFERAADIVEASTKYLIQWGHLALLMKLLQESAETTEGQTSAIALGNLATIYFSMGDYKAAKEKYEKVIKVLHDIGDKKNIAAVLHQLGNVHYQQGDYPAAVEKYQQSLEMKQELGNKAGIATTLHQLGMVHHDQGDYPAAVEKYQQSLEIKRELGDKAGIASTLHQLGIVHQQQGDYPAAVEKYQQSLKIEQELGNKAGIGQSLHQLGMVHHDQGDYPAAVEKYQQSLETFEELGSKREMAAVLHQLGRVHQDQENYPAAVEKYQQSLEIARELGDKAGIASSLHQLGVVHQQQGNYPAAVEKYQQSLEIEQELGNKLGIAQSFHALGNIHEVQGDLPAALEKLETARNIFEQIGAKRELAIAEESIARIKEKMQQA
jgi:tetratricopeptide (TPR) repeat protein